MFSTPSAPRASICMSPCASRTSGSSAPRLGGAGSSATQQPPPPPPPPSLDYPAPLKV